MKDKEGNFFVERSVVLLSSPVVSLTSGFGNFIQQGSLKFMCFVFLWDMRNSSEVPWVPFIPQDANHKCWQYFEARSFSNAT